MNSILYTSPLVSNTKAGVMNADYVPVAIQQVLSNFLRNSLDAAADGGCVTLRASTQFSQKMANAWFGSWSPIMDTESAAPHSRTSFNPSSQQGVW